MDFQKIEAAGIVPVIKIGDAKDAVPLARALIKGGIGVVEITFRTEAAAAAIALIRENVPEMYVGAGTIVNAAQLGEAVSAGARFAVSPGFNAEVVSAAQSSGVCVLPGVITPTEIMAALSMGLNVLKFFPASSFGGVSTIKALSAPFPSVKFVPTGGITPVNAEEYLRLGCVLAIGGSWLADEGAILRGEFDKIEKNAAEAAEIVKRARSGK